VLKTYPDTGIYIYTRTQYNHDPRNWFFQWLKNHWTSC